MESQAYPGCILLPLRHPSHNTMLDYPLKGRALFATTVSCIIRDNPIDLYICIADSATAWWIRELPVRAGVNYARVV
jgi:hypothetical protein